MLEIKHEEKTITLPAGFTFEGFSSGIKKNGALDTALIISSVPAACAGVFTTNKIQAACITRNKEILENNNAIRAIIINSGNANACTGPEGIDDNSKMADSAAQYAKADQKEVLTASTGVIGVKLPVEKIEKSLKGLIPSSDSSHGGFLRAGEAILTTDTRKKLASITLVIEGKTVTITGMAKGSGMIHPNMATMLSFFTTDAAISTELLSEILTTTVEETFNMISVDGDTSTNDMVLVLANGMAQNNEIQSSSSSLELFRKAFRKLAEYLAKAIAADGEGATKFLEVEVSGAGTTDDARKIAKAVVTSNLVKTAFFGMDPNWGRILAAVGYSNAQFDPEGISIYLQGAPGYSCLMDKGKPHDYDRGSVLGILKERNIIITINLTDGNANATAWGCDLSYDYVRINAEYTT